MMSFYENEHVINSANFVSLYNNSYFQNDCFQHVERNILPKINLTFNFIETGLKIGNEEFDSQDLSEFNYDIAFCRRNGDRGTCASCLKFISGMDDILNIESMPFDLFKTIISSAVPSPIYNDHILYDISLKLTEDDFNWLKYYFFFQMSSSLCHCWNGLMLETNFDVREYVMYLRTLNYLINYNVIFSVSNETYLLLSSIKSISESVFISEDGLIYFKLFCFILFENPTFSLPLKITFSELISKLNIRFPREIDHMRYSLRLSFESHFTTEISTEDFYNFICEQPEHLYLFKFINCSHIYDTYLCKKNYFYFAYFELICDRLKFQPLEFETTPLWIRDFKPLYSMLVASLFEDEYYAFKDQYFANGPMPDFKCMRESIELSDGYPYDLTNKLFSWSRVDLETDTFEFDPEDDSIDPFHTEKEYDDYDRAVTDAQSTSESQKVSREEKQKQQNLENKIKISPFELSKRNKKKLKKILRKDARTRKELIQNELVTDAISTMFSLGKTIDESQIGIKAKNLIDQTKVLLDQTTPKIDSCLSNFEELLTSLSEKIETATSLLHSAEITLFNFNTFMKFTLYFLVLFLVFFVFKSKLLVSICVAMILGFENFRFVKNLISSHFEQTEYVSTSFDLSPTVCSAFMTLIFTGASILFCNAVPKSKEIDSFIQRLDTIPRAFKGIVQMYDWCSAATSKVMDYVCIKLLKLDGYIPNEIVSEELQSWLDDIKFYCDNYDKIRPIYVKEHEHIEKMSRLASRGHSLLAQSKKEDWDPKLAARIRSSMPSANLITSLSRSVGHLSTQMDRTQPPFICFAGPPGSGKTAALNTLIQDMIISYFHGKPENITNDVFNHTAGEKFWDGYKGENIVNFDDYLQLKDNATVPNPELLDTIGLVNDATYYPMVADMNMKGKLLVDCKLVTASTNIHCLTNIIKSLHSTSAIGRRISHAYVVVPKKECRKNPNKEVTGSNIFGNDNSFQMAPEFRRSAPNGFKYNPKLWEFYKTNIETGEIQTSVSYTYKEVLENLISDMTAYYKRDAIHLAASKEYFATGGTVNTNNWDSFPDVGDYKSTIGSEDLSYIKSKLDDIKFGAIKELDPELYQALQIGATHFSDDGLVCKHPFYENFKYEILEFVKTYFAGDLPVNEITPEVLDPATQIAEFNLFRYFTRKIKESRQTFYKIYEEVKLQLKVLYENIKPYSKWILLLLSSIGIGLSAYFLLKETPKEENISMPITGEVFNYKPFNASLKNDKNFIETDVNEFKHVPACHKSLVQKSHKLHFCKYTNKTEQIFFNNLACICNKQSGSRSNGYRINECGLPLCFTCNQLRKELLTCDCKNVELINSNYVPIVNQKQFEQQMDKAFLNQFRMQFEQDEKFNIFNILFIKGTLAMTNAHVVEVIRSLRPEIEITCTNIIGTSIVIKRSELNLGTFYDPPKKNFIDLGVIEFPPRIHSFPNILGSFITDNDLKFISNDPRNTNIVGHINLLQSIKGVTSSHSHTLYRIYKTQNIRTGLKIVDGKPAYEISNLAAYENYVAVNGDCGAPIHLMNTQFNGRIAGIQSASSQAHARGFFTLITRESIEQFLNNFKINDALSTYTWLPNDTPIRETSLPEGNFFPLSKLDKPIYSPKNTKFIPSLLFEKINDIDGTLIENSFMPSAQVKVDEFGIPRNVIKSAVVKCGNIQPLIDTDLYNYCAERYFHSMKAYIPKNGFQMKTFDEVIKGVDGDKYRRGINCKSSMGLPYSQMGFPTGKWPFFKPDHMNWDLNSENCNLVRKRVQTAIEQMKNNIRPDFIFTDCSKDELRTLEKVKAGKTRSFAGSACDFYIISCMYTNDFFEWLREHTIMFGSCVGINVYDKEHVKAFINHLQKSGTDVIAADFTNFDGGQLSYKILKIFEEIDKLYLHATKEERLMRRRIAKELANSVHALGSTVYTWDHGTASGMSATAELNSLSLMIDIMFVLLSICPDRKTFNPETDISAVVYGDDMGIAFNKSKHPWITPHSVAEGFKLLGMSMTTEDKKEIVHDTPSCTLFNDFTFLKRKIVWDQDLKQFKMPLDTTSIFKSLYWVTTSYGDPVQQLGWNVENALAELSLHSNELFDYFYKQFSDLGVELGFTFRYRTYKQHVQSRNDGLFLGSQELLERMYQTEMRN